MPKPVSSALTYAVILTVFNLILLPPTDFFFEFNLMLTLAEIFFIEAAILFIAGGLTEAVSTPYMRHVSKELFKRPSWTVNSYKKATRVATALIMAGVILLVEAFFASAFPI